MGRRGHRPCLRREQIVTPQAVVRSGAFDDDVDIVVAFELLSVASVAIAAEQVSVDAVIACAGGEGVVAIVVDVVAGDLVGTAAVRSEPGGDRVEAVFDSVDAGTEVVFAQAGDRQCVRHEGAFRVAVVCGDVLLSHLILAQARNV